MILKENEPVKIIHIDCVKEKPLYGYDGKMLPEFTHTEKVDRMNGNGGTTP